ncbi:MAG: hypothetical protein ACTHKB_12650 [Burkholderiaceae bacterium]
MHPHIDQTAVAERGHRFLQSGFVQPAPVGPRQYPGRHAGSERGEPLAHRADRHQRTGMQFADLAARLATRLVESVRKSAFARGFFDRRHTRMCRLHQRSSVAQRGVILSPQDAAAGRDSALVQGTRQDEHD